ncbi:MAG: hypothetical protein CO128_01675 [Ignavibacteriales bacterium CG_4_9_14_3_um_filter_30_11]|nr:MAG: hypothetical protein CO128_01675 [Ignavibacteriales bacterium CG_4_9_14_3_um_filter_30_11]
MGQPIAYNYFTLIFIGSLIGVFVGIIISITQYFVWRFWGIEKVFQNIQDIQNQLEKINYKINLFVKESDMIDINEKDKLN